MIYFWWETSYSNSWFLFSEFDSADSISWLTNPKDYFWASEFSKMFLIDSSHLKDDEWAYTLVDDNISSLDF